MTVAFHSAFWISTQVVAALFGCYMAWATWNCCHLHASSVYTIPPCTSSHYLQCHFIWSPIYTFSRMTRIFYVLLWKQGGGMDTKIRVSTESWPCRRKLSHCSWDLNPRPLNHESITLPLSHPRSPRWLTFYPHTTLTFFSPPYGVWCDISLCCCFYQSVVYSVCYCAL